MSRVNLTRAGSGTDQALVDELDGALPGRCGYPISPAHIDCADTTSTCFEGERSRSARRLRPPTGDDSEAPGRFLR